MAKTKKSFTEFAAEMSVLKGYDHFPQLHREFAEWLEQTATKKSKRLWMAFRHSSKSEISADYVLWRISQNPNYTCVILCADDESASEKSKYIRQQIERHPRMKHLVPDSNERWQVHNFTVRRTMHRLAPTVRIASVQGRITGKHGDELIIDDIETSDNCLTAGGRQRLRTAMREARAMADAHLVIGTPHDEDTLYDTLENKWGYITRKWPVYKDDGTPQWPEIRGEEWIESMRMGADGEPATMGWFKSQYLLIPAKAYETLMSWENITEYQDAMERAPSYLGDSENPQGAVWWIGDDEIVDAKAYWDPASGLQCRDDSAVMLACVTRDGKVLLHDGEILPSNSGQKGDYSKQIFAVLNFCKKNHIRKIYVESNHAPHLSFELRKLAESERVRVQVFATTRKSTQNKRFFIANALEPLVKSNRLWVHKNVLKTKFKEQLNAFPNTRSDDCIDAAAGAIHELNIPMPRVFSGKDNFDRLIRTDFAEPVQLRYKPHFSPRTH